MGRFRGFGEKIKSLHTPRNYWQQDIKRGEISKMLLQSAGVVVATGWLYYHSLWSVTVLWPIGVWYYRKQVALCIQKKQAEFLARFKEMIQSMAASLNTGYSVENALKETHREMLLMCRKDDLIIKELAFMVQQVNIHIPTEQILEEFAGRLALEEIRNFSAVFGAAKRSGGDMLGIIRNTADQIGDKIDVRREIDTILAAKRYEFRVMSVIPYGIIAYMTVSFSEFMNCLYGNLLGIGVMSVCLGVYLGAYVLGVKVADIEV